MGGEDCAIPVRAGLTDAQVQDLREVFGLFDPEGTGRVIPAVVRAAFCDAGLERDSTDIWQLISPLMSEDPVDFEQFVALVTHPLGDARSIRGAEQMLSLVGPAAAVAGSIGPQDLLGMVEELGLEMHVKELRGMLEAAGAGPDGRLSAKELRKVLATSDVDEHPKC